MEFKFNKQNCSLIALYFYKRMRSIVVDYVPEYATLHQDSPRCEQNNMIKKSILEVAQRKKYEKTESEYRSNRVFRYASIIYRIKFPTLNLNFKVDDDLECKLQDSTCMSMLEFMVV